MYHLEEHHKQSAASSPETQVKGKEQRQNPRVSAASLPGRQSSPRNESRDSGYADYDDKPYHSPDHTSTPGDSTPVPSGKETQQEAFEKKEHGLPAKLSLDNFDMLKNMGSGTFARVWLVRPKNQNKNDVNVFALKILRKADVVKLKQVDHINSETQCLRTCSWHPYVVPLINTFSDKENLYILTGFCPGGELFTYLRHMLRFDLRTTRIYAAEMILVLEYLHEERGIIYRDLKPENMLLGSDGHLQLVDFGFAKEIHDQQTYTLCGTPEYFAPEVIRSHGHGLAADWWSLGVLIYEFLTGQPPFWDAQPMKIYELIIEGQITFPQNFDPDARDIVSQFCQTEPSRRLGVIDGGAKEIKRHPFFKEIDWDALFQKKIPAPIVPHLTNPADASNFEQPPPQMQYGTPYTKSMQAENEELFKENF